MAGSSMSAADKAWFTNLFQGLQTNFDTKFKCLQDDVGAKLT